MTGRNSEMISQIFKWLH